MEGTFEKVIMEMNDKERRFEAHENEIPAIS